MFAIKYFAFILVAVSSVALANPANLQSLYGTPTNDQSHDHAHHSVDIGDSQPLSGNPNFVSEAQGSSSSISNSHSVEHESFVNVDGTLDTGSHGSDIGGSASNAAEFPLGSNSVNEPSRSDEFNAVASSGSFSSNSLNNAGNSVTGGTFGGPLDSSLGNRISNLSPSINSVPISGINGPFGSNFQADITITRVVTEDVFTTLANVFYNTIPVTLTQFMKTTAVAPTFQVISTAVDNKVFVATAPVTRTDTVTVVNTRTGHHFATEVSTDVYTITHSAFNIQQQVVTSTVVQTQVFRPTVVSTRIDTEYDTATVVQTVTNTVVVGSGNSFSGFAPDRLSVPRSGSMFEQRLHQDVLNNRLDEQKRQLDAQSFFNREHPHAAHGHRYF